MTIDRFREEPEISNAAFIYSAPLQDGCARIRVAGTFESKSVIRDTTVMTLAHFNSTAADTGHETLDHQFIDVGHTDGDIRRIEIGLQLDRIDEQALLKTIIMVRKNKRMHTGRHEFGHALRLR